MKKGLLSLLILCCGAGAYAADMGGYLFVTFRGEGSPMTEQVYFMVSENGRDWKALNEAEPVRSARLQLSRRTADTLGSGLGLLGIGTVDRM